MNDTPPFDALATVTHARLRAAQGDIAGARRLLETVLARRPEDLEARALLARLTGVEQSPLEEPEPEPLEPPVAGDPAALASSFRGVLNAAATGANRRKAERLRALLDRIARRRGGGPGAR